MTATKETGLPMLDDKWFIDRELAQRLPRAWPAFFGRFGRLSPVQRAVMADIIEGRDVLVCAPTAGGKTEAACAPLVERFVDRQTAWVVLYIAPTRALVNDLYERLAGPLESMGLRCARRTGDHHDPLEVPPHVLITTPESFDSLMCRGRDPHRGHVLAHVCAVIIDEIHLLWGSSRGKQLQWLLERLRRLRQFGVEKGWARSAELQVVGLSATVPDPEAVKAAFLSSSATAILVPGGRDIEEVVPPGAAGPVEESLPLYLGSIEDPEKVLVFCNARKRVDAMASHLAPALAEFGYVSRGHHGSLSPQEREAAEAAVKGERRIVLFATSTLEVGVDIGDIDLVVLDGPAPDMAAFLQRIGRGNRRTGRTRVMLCHDDTGEALVQRAMLEAARCGYLGPLEVGPSYAVARQQLASYIFQGSSIYRKQETLHGFLATLLAPDEATSLLAHLVENGDFERSAAGIKLGDEWNGATEYGQIHSVIEGQPGSTVTDHTSGEAIAVNVQYKRGKRMSIAGSQLRVTSVGDHTIEVARSSGTGDPAEWSYGSAVFIKGASQPQAVRRHLGFAEDEWPAIDVGERTWLFHFGGARRKALLDLMALRAGVKGSVSLNEFALLLPNRTRDQPSWFSVGPATLELLIAEHIAKLERLLARPKANQRLPLDLRVAEVRGWLAVAQQLEVIRSARLVRPATLELYNALLSLVAP